jgi:hypothetical protein
LPTPNLIFFNPYSGVVAQEQTAEVTGEANWHAAFVANMTKTSKKAQDEKEEEEAVALLAWSPTRHTL